jgi:hypothetical protein
MALPGVIIGQNIYYYPTSFDAELLSLGSGPMAAIITGIYPDDTVAIAVFPPDGPTRQRKGIKYMPDVDPNKPFFILTYDSAPACSTEKVSAAIVNTDVGSFTVQWTHPASHGGTFVRYRETGATDWLNPNEPGNASGEYTSGTEFVFTAGFVNGTSYDILIINVCPNSEFSPGTIVTDTATVAP